MGKMDILKDFFKLFMATFSTGANYSMYHYLCGQKGGGYPRKKPTMFI